MWDWIKILLLVSTITAGCLAQLSCDHADNCNHEDGNLATITCKKGGTPNECTCSGAECSRFDPTTTPASFENINDGECERLCADDSDLAAPCEFFKWIVDPPITEMKRCFLMSASQCTDTSTYPCDEDHCLSGGINCDGTDPTEQPGLTGCLIDGLTYRTDGPFLHYTCVDKHGYPVNVYDESKADIAVGTKCTATHKCSKLAPSLPEYTCTDGGDGQTKKWDPVIEPTDTLAEQECKGDPLELNKNSYEQEGLMITCTGNGVQMVAGKPTVEEPNICMLLCDYYPILRFYADWKGKDGDRAWYYQLLVGDDQETATEIDDASVIKCWQK